MTAVDKAQERHRAALHHAEAELTAVIAQLTQKQVVIDRYFTDYERRKDRQDPTRRTHRQALCRADPATAPPRRTPTPHRHGARRDQCGPACHLHRPHQPHHQRRHRRRMQTALRPAHRRPADQSIDRHRHPGLPHRPHRNHNRHKHKSVPASKLARTPKPSSRGVRERRPQVDRMWQNPNRIPAARGPTVIVSAVRRRASWRVSGRSEGRRSAEASA